MKNEVCDCGKEIFEHRIEPMTGKILYGLNGQCPAYHPTTKSIEATSRAEGREVLACPMCQRGQPCHGHILPNALEFAHPTARAIAKESGAISANAFQLGYDTGTTHTERLEAALQEIRDNPAQFCGGSGADHAQRICACDELKAFATAALASAALPESEI